MKDRTLFTWTRSLRDSNAGGLGFGAARRALLLAFNMAETAWVCVLSVCVCVCVLCVREERGKEKGEKKAEVEVEGKKADDDDDADDYRRRRWASMLPSLLFFRVLAFFSPFLFLSLFLYFSLPRNRETEK